MAILDISVSLINNMIIWPGSPGFNLIKTSDMKNGDTYNNSKIDCDVHIGTHIDAPRHFLRNGSAVEEIPLKTMIGDALVIDLRGEKCITAELLDNQNIPENTQRILFKTNNSQLWISKKRKFEKEFVALKPDASQWIVDHGIKLVGIDYLSIQPFSGGSETHTILLVAGIVILEGLNLNNIPSGEYELICLPLKVIGAEGAPARAILRSKFCEGS